jgi:short-subunit dehydrogenase
MKSVHNKVVVITGAANGLGKAMAMEYHRLGAHLALLDIDDYRLVQLKEQLSGNGPEVSAHTMDVSHEAEVVRCKDDILAIHGRVDILVNNSGVSISQYFEDQDIDDHRALFEVNYWGAVYCTRHFLPELQKGQGSHLINIISDFALMGFPAKTAYASSKSALMGFTNTLYTELHPGPVIVSLVIPPPLDTDIVINGKHIDSKKQYKEYQFLKRNAMPIDKAAHIIVRRIMHGKYRIVVGSMMYWSDLLSRLFPTLVHRFIARNKRAVDFL